MEPNRSWILPFLLALTLLSCRNEQFSILIEAESFEDKGGWVIDPQFVEQMGSPYLLAHGLGNPVNNAKTQIKLPHPDYYHVWVRTFDWAPGNWESPGRFSLIINGSILNEELGTIKNWDWQYAGNLHLEESVQIELQDLTGFNGRCDAIYISTNKHKPPSKAMDLNEWRKKQLAKTGDPDSVLSFDLVIVGGGIAGCAASIAAAEQGLNVALVHDRPVLGGNASSEIRVHTEGITWNSDRILKLINTEWWPNGSPDSKMDDEKRHQSISLYPNISTFLNWRAYDALTTGDSITAIDARETSGSGRIRFKAPLFIDCTGDGWIGYWAGAEYMYGREASSEFDEYWEEHGDLWSPSEADQKVMGASVLWRTSICEDTCGFPEVPWAMKTANEYEAINGTWQWEFSRDDLHQIDDAEYLRDHMLMAIFGSFYNAKKDSANQKLKLDWVSYLIGKRESRRLVGDYIYSFNDVREMREFPDMVVREKRPVDVHYQQNLVDERKPDFLSEALYYQVDHYDLPYRSLYSKDISNLFMAGRCFSCSHIGLGGPRVMHTTGQMGVAVGYAASLCIKYSTNPRGIYTSYIKELQGLINSN